MLYANLGFGFVALILSGLAIKQMRAMKAEIASLPALPKKVDTTRPPQASVGKNVLDILSTDLIEHSYTVLSVTAPTCSFCHSALEEFLEQNKGRPLAFVNLLAIDGEDEKAISQFLQRFEGAFKTITVTNEITRNLMIGAFPTFLLINSEGDVVHETGWYKSVFTVHEDLLRKDGF